MITVHHPVHRDFLITLYNDQVTGWITSSVLGRCCSFSPCHHVWASCGPVQFLSREFYEQCFPRGKGHTADHSHPHISKVKKA